jgi:hypothetical protein
MVLQNIFEKSAILSPRSLRHVVKTQFLFNVNLLFSCLRKLHRMQPSGNVYPQFSEHTECSFRGVGFRSDAAKLFQYPERGGRVCVITISRASKCRRLRKLSE